MVKIDDRGRKSINMKSRDSASIAFIGAGVVGLTTAAFFANKGLKTIITDKNRNRLQAINHRNIPFYEPMLDKLVNNALNSGNLIIEYDIIDSIRSADIIFITVGTPSLPDGSIDLTQVSTVVENIAIVLKREPSNKTIVVKSTVVPTTTSKIIYPLICNKEYQDESRVDVLVNPEFLREGSAVHDTVNPHIIVIGSNNGRGFDTLDRLYKQIYHDKINNIPIIHTTWENAELIKYANNAFLATKISFINTIANICSRIDNADVDVVARAIGLDPRIGPLFLKAGPGYGGSCLPKDVTALIRFSQGVGYEPYLLNAVHEVNEHQAEEVISITKKMLGSLNNKIISILGLSFKKDTDDIRNAVSLRVINYLLKSGSKVKVHDPKALDNVKAVFGNNIEYCVTIQDCLENSDCCIILVDWDEYKILSANNFSIMREKNVVDTWRILEANRLVNINYKAIGKN